MSSISLFQGAVGPEGAQGPPGEQYALDSDTAVGATTFTLNVTPEAPVTTQQFLLIDAYTSQAEVRKITAVSGTTITVAALAYAHAEGDRVLTVTSGFLTPAHWGCKGDGSTNDHTGLQEAIYQCGVNGLWLDGQAKVYEITQPLLLPTGSKLRGVNPKADSTFAPIETNNAMGMSYNGNRLAFTADAGTDVLTTVTAHAAPGDDTGVIFQGSALPGGLTEGKFYYIRDRTTFTFKVSATAGGSAVDITSAGSGGTAYFEVYAANARTIMEDCLWDGFLLTGLNGLLLSVQQPGYADKLRVDDFDGYGVKMKGQQYVLYNFMSDQCRKTLVLDDMAFLYAYSFNAEKCDRAIYIDSGGAHACMFSACHFEMNSGSGYSTAASIAVEFAGNALSMTFDNVSVSMNVSGQTFFKSDAASANGTSYSLRNVYWSGGIGSAGQIMVNDADRGISLDQQDDCRGVLQLLEAPRLPSSQSFDDLAPIVFIGPGGRKATFGAQNNDQPLIHAFPGSTLTGDQVRADDSSGNRVSGFNKAGVFFTERNTVPADADLVAGEMTLWLDDTNGAAKLMIKAKQADGTVRTGSVALA